MIPTGALAALAVFLSMLVVFVLKTWADTIFLGEYGAALVPHFIAAQAIVMAGLSSLYGLAIRNRASLALDLGIMVALAAVAMGGPAGAQVNSAAPFVVAVALVSLSSLAFLAVWNAAIATAPGRAARPFIARAGAAATLGAVVGGLGGSALVALAGSDTLAPAGGVVAVIVGVQLLLLRREPGAYVERHPARPPSLRGVPRPAHARRLIAWVVAACLIEAVLGAIVDFGFKREVSLAYDRDQMGLFFALFHGTSNAILLGVQLLWSRLMAAVPLRRSLSLAPAAALLSAAAWVISPTLALAVTTRGVDLVGRFGVARPAQELALSPLGRSDLNRWKVLVRGVFSQAGAAAAGLLLIAAAPLMVRDPVVVPLCVALLALAWLVVQRWVARGYLDTLGSALGHRQLSRAEAEQLELDGEGVARVVDLIGSPDADLAAFGCDILSTSLPDPGPLLGYLRDPRPAVRLAVYRALARSPRAARLAELSAAVAREEPGSPTFVAGLDALAAHGDASAAPRVDDWIGAAPPAADAATLAGWSYLARVGALDRRPVQLRAVLAALMPSDGAAAAVLWCEAIERGAVSEAETDEAIVAATAAEGPAGAQGLRCAAASGRSRPLVQLLQSLERGRPEADIAVAELGDAGIGRLLMLVNARTSSARMRGRLIRALRASPLPQATDLAGHGLADPDRRVRTQAVHTLQRHARERPGSVRRDLVAAAIDAELEHLAIYVHARDPRIGHSSSMVFRHDLRTISDGEFLADELERRTEASILQVCDLISVLGNGPRVRAAGRALLAPTARERSKGVNILQEAARGRYRGRLLALLDTYLDPRHRPTDEQRTAAYRHDPWLERCAKQAFTAEQSIIWALRSTPLFDQMDGEALVALVPLVDEVACAPDVPVIRAGQPGDALYIVVSGLLVVRRDGAEVSRISPGHSVGELPFIDGRGHDADVVPAQPSIVLRLPREPLERAIADHPEIGLGLLRALVHWVNRAAPASRAAGR